MRNFGKLSGFIAFAAVILMILSACDDSGTSQDTSCTHNWDWVSTKIPTTTEEGIETYKCLHCGHSGTTRPVPVTVNTISAVSISITAPVKGAAPNNTALTINSGYTLGTVSWTPSDNPFLGGKDYTAVISLTANNGFSFTGLNSANINGQNGIIANNTGTNASISYTFPTTPAKTVSGISIKTQPNNLTYTHNDHLDLSGLVVTLTYDDTTTEDVSAANFTGKSINANPAHGNILDRAAHNNNPVVITYGNFSQSTNNLIVNNKAITGVEINITAPVKNAIPVVTANGSGDYSIGTVTWFPAHSKFLGGEVYTASVTLTANSGFVFTGLSFATVNGQNNSISNNTGTSITLTHTFSKTNEKTVSGLAIKSQPSRLTYTHGNHLELSGLVVTFTYDDGTTEDIAAASFDSKNINANPADGNSLTRVNHNGKPVVITYGGLTAQTNNLTVNSKVITFSVDPVSSVTFTGIAHTPVVTVRDTNLLLTLGADYTVGYTNNINAGTATVTVTGINNYQGSTGNTTFTINPIAADLIINAISSVTFNGNAHTPTITVRNGTTTLTHNTHYTAEYSNNINAGTATVTVTGIGNYHGSSGNTTFTINPKVVTFTVDTITAQIYTGNAITPAITVRDGTTVLTSSNYNTSYTNNINAGTASVAVTGINNYQGSSGSSTFTINKAAGAIVDVPTVASRTHNRITINVVAAPNNGQTIEYARSTSNTTPSTGWQSGLTFDGLSAGTTYYIFARSASNNNYNAGTAVNMMTTTYFQQGLTITFDAIIDAAPIIVNQTISRTGSNKTVTLTVSNPAQYSSIGWHVTGTNVSGSENSFTLDSSNPEYNRVGEHFLTLEVWKDGKPYNKTIIFTVTQ